MGSAMKYTLLATAMVALLVASGCKSDSSYKDHERTQGEEVEAMEERGNTAIDAADEAEE
jgi:hypothetical protein